MAEKIMVVFRVFKLRIFCRNCCLCRLVIEISCILGSPGILVFGSSLGNT